MKKNVKRLFSLMLVGILVVFTFAACGKSDSSQTNNDEAKKYTWKAANVLSPGGAWDQGLQEFAKLLNEKSNGAITLEVYSGAQLGSERDTIEGLQLGSVDFVICSSATLSNFTDTQNVWDLPFLFYSTEAARNVLDSEIGDESLATLSDVSIKGLSYWENGMYILGATKPIQKPEDLKGMRVRTIESSLQADLYTCFDASSVVIAWGDIYTSLQQGVVDVTTTTLPNMYSAKHNEVAKYVTQAGQIYGPAPLLMSQALWDSLPEDIKEIVQSAADEAKLVERAAVDKATEDAVKAIESEGGKVYQINVKEWADFVDPVYDKYVGTMGIDADMVEEVKKMAEKYN